MFQDQVFDTKFNMLQTDPVPFHTQKMASNRKPISNLYVKEQQSKAKEALSRVVKTINLKKRMSIIRQINETIDKVKD